MPEDIRIEVDIAKEADPLEAGVMKLGEPSNFACPECHGVLLKMKASDRGPTRFRCHTGHAYSQQSLVADLKERKQEALWNALRAMQEEMLLLRHLAEAQHHDVDSVLAQELLKRADEAQRHIDSVRRALLQHPSATPRS